MFFLMSESEFACYADGNTPYVAFDNGDNAIKNFLKMIPFN